MSITRICKARARCVGSDEALALAVVVPRAKVILQVVGVDHCRLQSSKSLLGNLGAHRGRIGAVGILSTLQGTAGRVYQGAENSRSWCAARIYENATRLTFEI